MKIKQTLVLIGFIGLAYGYTQSDLLNAQYAYQSATDKVSQAKDEKAAASDALATAKKNVVDAKKQLQQAESALNAAQIRYKKADVRLIENNHNFANVNVKLNQIWQSLNPTNK